MNRYDIKPEGLGEINIDLSDNGDWVRYDDIEHLLSGVQKTAHNSDYTKSKSCANCSILYQCNDFRKHPEWHCEKHDFA